MSHTPDWQRRLSVRGEEGRFKGVFAGVDVPLMFAWARKLPRSAFVVAVSMAHLCGELIGAPSIPLPSDETWLNRDITSVCVATLSNQLGATQSQRYISRYRRGAAGARVLLARYVEGFEPPADASISELDPIDPYHFHFDTVEDPQRTVSYFRYPDPANNSVQERELPRAGAEYRFHLPLDDWSSAIRGFNSGDERNLADLLSESHYIKRASAAEIAGLLSDEFEFSGPGGTYKVWYCPEYKFGPVKYEVVKGPHDMFRNQPLWKFFLTGQTDARTEREPADDSVYSISRFELREVTRSEGEIIPKSAIQTKEDRFADGRVAIAAVEMTLRLVPLAPPGLDGFDSQRIPNETPGVFVPADEFSDGVPRAWNGSTLVARVDEDRLRKIEAEAQSQMQLDRRSPQPTDYLLRSPVILTAILGMAVLIIAAWSLRRGSRHFRRR